jgi:hypothetical protein
LLSGPHTRAQADDRAKQLEQLKTEYQDAQTKIRQNSPRYAALTQPQPLTVAELQQQVLDADTLLLEYALGARTQLPLGRNAKFHRQLRATQTRRDRSDGPPPAHSVDSAQPIYRWRNGEPQTRAHRAKPMRRPRARLPRSVRLVLEPAAAQLNKKRLLIVADGVLQYVPFSALPDQRRRAERWRRTRGTAITLPHPSIPHPSALIARHEIISLPSASTLAVLRRELAARQPAAHTVAVLADPVFDPRDERLKASASAIGASLNPTRYGQRDTRIDARLERIATATTALHRARS